MKIYLWRNIVWCIVIFISCVIPDIKLPSIITTIPYVDKIIHFGLFYVMSVFICADLRHQTNLAYSKIAVIAIVLVTSYGAITELLQHYLFIGRSGEFMDLLADILGGIVGVFIYRPLKFYTCIFIRKTHLNRFPFLKKIL